MPKLKQRGGTQSQEAFRKSYKILVKGFFVLVLSCNITENSNIMGK